MHLHVVDLVELDGRSVRGAPEQRQLGGNFFGLIHPLSPAETVGNVPTNSSQVPPTAWVDRRLVVRWAGEVYPGALMVIRCPVALFAMTAVTLPVTK